MNALEKLAPKELEQHLLLNFVRFKTFEDMEKEVVNYMEAKTGNRMVISTNFAKAAASSGPVPMDVDSRMKLVSGNIASGKDQRGWKGQRVWRKGNSEVRWQLRPVRQVRRKKGCWSKDKSGGKGNASSRSISTSPKKFSGKCRHGGKPGHKKSECRALAGKGKRNQAIKSFNLRHQLKAVLNQNLQQQAVWNFVHWRSTP